MHWIATGTPWDALLPLEAGTTRLELAATGRARCRACNAAVPRGALRFGEQLPNPFNDKPTWYWYHIECAALRRSSSALPVFETLGQRTTVEPDLTLAVTRGAANPRLERLMALERAPSGRAKCRACEQLIVKGHLRFPLQIFDSGRFTPIGYIHDICQLAYCGAELDPMRAAALGVGTPEVE